MSFSQTIKEYTWLIILATIAFSLLYPAPGLMLKPTVFYLLMGLMFISTLNVRPLEIVKNCKNFHKKLIILAIIHLLSPLLILIFKPILTEELFLGFIIATVIPSGLAVVFLSKHYGGNETISLVITTISNVLSPITVPLLVFLFAQTSIEIDYLSMIRTMLTLVVIPLVLAQIVQRTPIKKPLNDASVYISIVLLTLIIIGLISPIQATIFSQPLLALYLFLVICTLHVIHFLLGYALGKTHAERISYGISASYKNFTLASTLALTLFGPMVALPPLMYALVNNLLLVPMQLFFTQRS